MSEAAYNIVALGRQSDIGTAVAASTVFPVDAGFTGFELDRGTESPDEDFGSSSREWPGRESHGIRWATASLPFTARFQDLMHPLEMHVDTIGTATGTAPYVWAYTFDDTGALLNTALKPYTLEYGVDTSTQDEWRAVGVIADSLEMGFDALQAPGNSPWKGTLGLVAIDREANALTGTATAPATLETLEGHLTTLSTGSTSTAFASLTALTGSLRQFSFRSSLNAVGRAYGGATDKATAIGRGGKGTVEFDALVGIGSASKTAIHDVFGVSGSAASEQRWRIAVAGSGSSALTLDFRCRFRAVNVGEDSGERLYAVSGVWVRDATLGGRGTITLSNTVAAIP